MKKRSLIPQTKVKNPEPKEKDDNWVIWAAWADRITFEEIKEKPINECLELANKVAGISTTKLGAGDAMPFIKDLN